MSVKIDMKEWKTDYHMC